MPTDDFINTVYQSCLRLRDMGFEMIHATDVRDEVDLRINDELMQSLYATMARLTMEGKLQSYGCGYYGVKEV